MKLTEAGYQILPKIKPYQECGVETTTDGKKIVTIFGETTNAEVKIYSPIYSPTEEKLEEELK